MLTHVEKARAALNDLLNEWSQGMKDIRVYDKVISAQKLLEEITYDINVAS